MPAKPFDLVQRGRGPVRSKIIYVRCTPEEDLALKAAATRYTWTVGDLVRAAIAKYLTPPRIEKPKPRKETKKP